MSLSIIIIVKKHKRKIQAYKEEIYSKCMDILNLNYIMVAEKKSSLNVYDQVFTKQKLDPTLISGFLSAMDSFVSEIGGTTSMNEINYKGFYVHAAYGQYIKLALFLSKPISPNAGAI